MYPDQNHILVIDSETTRRQLTERVLLQEGFVVTAVSEGFSAIRAASCHRFALALTAVQLPGTLDGVVTVRQIRAGQPRLKALYTGEAARRPALPDLGRDDFIASPYLGRELLGCVFELLQRDPSREAAGLRYRGRAG